MAIKEAEACVGGRVGGIQGSDSLLGENMCLYKTSCSYLSKVHLHSTPICSSQLHFLVNHKFKGWVDVCTCILNYLCVF